MTTVSDASDARAGRGPVAGPLAAAGAALVPVAVGRRTRPASIGRSRWRRIVTGGPSLVLASLLVMFLALPLVGLVWRALTSGGFVDAVQRPVVVEAIRLTALTTALVMVLTLIFGTPLAMVLARSHFRGIGLIDSIVDLPIVLPPAVAGLALLLTFGRRGMLGPALSAVGVELPFTTAAVVLASFFVAAPFYVRAARSGFLSVPREYEEAARVEGATEWQVLRHVTLPIASPALFGGAVLCWARAVGEFGATIMFAGQFLGRTQTMPLAIYSALESDTNAALSLSLLLLLISAVLLISFRRWLRVAADGS